MPIFPPAYAGPREIKYLFVDGGCLRACLNRTSENYASGAALDLDYSQLTGAYQKVFYYDALPPRESMETDEKYRDRTAQERQLLDTLSSLDRFHVYEGDVRRSSSRRGPEQKKVDVMIAVDMLTHSFRRNMHEATLLTGDLDFKPLIDALVQEGMFVTLWYPLGKTSKELIASADKSIPFHVEYVHAALKNPKPFALPVQEQVLSRGEYTTIVQTWQINGKYARLLKEPNQFVVEIQTASDKKAVTYFKHGDEMILRHYLRDVRSVVVPPR